MSIPRIKDISVIECAPGGSRLTVVKITTDQDGLYGYGCATFTQRADLVKPAVERYLKPFLLGKTTDRIEDIWQSCYSSYWKDGPVLNNALSGIDRALWDKVVSRSKRSRFCRATSSVAGIAKCAFVPDAGLLLPACGCNPESYPHLAPQSKPKIPAPRSSTPQNSASAPRV